KELKEFIAYLKERTKAPVPDWWATAMTDVDLFPGQHHAFERPAEPKRGDATGLRTAEPELNVDSKGNDIVCSTKEHSVSFPKDTFEEVAFPAFVGRLGDKRSVIAGYTPIAGGRYQVAGFEGKGGKPAWRADVWSAGRDVLAGLGFHKVGMT